MSAPQTLGVISEVGKRGVMNMGGYEKLQNTEKMTIVGRSGKTIFWNIFFSGCHSMDVGRSGEVQGVVGRVWVVEIT